MLAVGKDSPNIKIWDIIDQSTATSKILPADFSNCQLANENSPLLYSAHNSNANDSPEYSNDSPEHLPFSENNDQTLDKSTIHPMVPLVWRIRQGKKRLIFYSRIDFFCSCNSRKISYS